MASHCVTVYKWSKPTYNCLCCLAEKLLHFLPWFTDFVYTSGLKGCGQLFKMDYQDAIGTLVQMYCKAQAHFSSPDACIHIFEIYVIG